MHAKKKINIQPLQLPLVHHLVVWSVNESNVWLALELSCCFAAAASAATALTHSQRIQQLRRMPGCRFFFQNVAKHTHSQTNERKHKKAKTAYTRFAFACVGVFWLWLCLPCCMHDIWKCLPISTCTCRLYECEHVCLLMRRLKSDCKYHCNELLLLSQKLSSAASKYSLNIY